MASKKTGEKGGNDSKKRDVSKETKFKKEGRKRVIDDSKTVKKLEDIIAKADLTPEEEATIINSIKNPKAEIKKKKVVYEFSDHHLKIGVVTDTHLNSIFSNLECLTWLYDKFKEEGVEFVVHAGDITDGDNMHPGHAYKLIKPGVDPCIDYVVENYPKSGLDTFFIAGNHDNSYKKKFDVDICRWISKERDDLIYIPGLKDITGDELRRITGNKKFKGDKDLNFEGDIYVGPKKKTKIKLFHPGKGTAQAWSYQKQKLIEHFWSDEKPNILIIGHYHKMDYVFDRNVHCFEAGTTQEQTEFMRPKNLTACMGGMILDIFMKEDGTVDKIKYRPLVYGGK